MGYVDARAQHAKCFSMNKSHLCRADSVREHEFADQAAVLVDHTQTFPHTWKPLRRRALSQRALALALALALANYEALPPVK